MTPPLLFLCFDWLKKMEGVIRNSVVMTLRVFNLASARTTNEKGAHLSDTSVVLKIAENDNDTSQFNGCQ